MKLKALSQAVLAASLVSGTAVAQAEEEKGFEIAGNVAIVSDYRFRGISQTDGGPAIQGGFDVEHESGLYAGVWGSNIDFGPAFDGTIEIDYYVGFGGELSKDVSYDIGWAWYDYPQGDSNAQNLDYYEWYASVSAFGLTLGTNYSPDYTGDLNSYNYYYVGYSVGLPADISLDLHYGINDFDDSTDSFFGHEHYDDWSVGLSKDAFGVSWGLTYVDTNVSDSDCGSSDNCSSAVVFSVSKSL